MKEKKGKLKMYKEGLIPLIPAVVGAVGLAVGIPYLVKMSDNENELEQKYYHSEQVENYIDNVENGFISSVDNANNENMEDNTYSFNFADSKYLNSEKVYRDVADVMYRNDENYQALLKQNITYSLAGLFPTIFGSVGLFSSAIWNIMDVMNGVGIKDYFYREEPSKSDDDDKNNDDNTEENTL